MLVFIVVEKLFAASEGEEEEEEAPPAKQNGVIKQIEIEEIEKLLVLERKQRGGSKGGLCNGTVTAKELYDTCVFNNNTKGKFLRSVTPKFVSYVTGQDIRKAKF